MMSKSLFLSLLISLLVSCTKGQAPSQTTGEPQKKPLVLVTIAPYQFLVEKLGHGLVRVETIIPTGTNPHSYEPTIRQVAGLKEAFIWFQVGELFEEKILSPMKERNPELIAYDLRDGLDMISLHEGCCSKCAHHDHFDRHIWLSPTRLAQQAEMVANALIQKFPDQKELIEKRLFDFKNELSSLNEELTQMLAPLEGRSLVVSHPALGYFCNDFALEQLSIEQEGKEPRPRHLEKVLIDAKKTHASLAIAMPQYSNKGVELVSKELKIPLYTIDPYAPDCLNTMKNLAEQLIDSAD